MKKIIMVVLVISGLLIGSLSVAQAVPLAVKDKTYEGITLRYIAEAVPPTDAVLKLVPEFEKASGIKVEFEIYPYEYVIEKETTDLIGKTRIYDVMSVPYEHLGRYVEMGWCQPLEKFFENPQLKDPQFDWNDLIMTSVKLAGMWKDKLYGFPSNNCTHIVMYREDLMNNPIEKRSFKEKYGYELHYPSNLVQYKDQIEFFTRKKGEKLAGKILDRAFYGTALSAKRHPALYCEWMDFMFAFGGNLLDENGDPIVNSPENIEALEYYFSLFKYAPPGTKEYTWDEVSTIFQQDQAYMAVQWSDVAFGVEDPEKSKVAGKMRYGVVPRLVRPTSHYGPWSYLMPTASKHPEAAFLFIQWASSKEVQLKLAKMGMIAFRYSTYDNPEIKKMPILPDVVLALEVAQSRPRIPEWPEFSSSLILHLSEAITGEKTAKEALDVCQKDFERILRK